jgi:hypothetical protein
MKHTFIAPNGGRLHVEPSPTRGYVWLRYEHPDGPTPIVAIPLHQAGVVAQAIEATATLLEEACLQPELGALISLETSEREVHA